MITFKNIIHLKNQTTWTDLPNTIYIIPSIYSLKLFFESNFPELAKLKIEQNDRVELWNPNNKELFDNILSKLGIKFFHTVHDILVNQYFDKKLKFLFLQFYIFKFNINGVDKYYFKNYYAKDKNIEDIISEFKKNIKENLIENYGEDILVVENETN